MGPGVRSLTKNGIDYVLEHHNCFTGRIIFATNILTMRKIIFLSFLGLASIVQAQSNAELDERNGFKDIKLLSKASELKTLQFSGNVKGEEFQSIYKPVNGAYSSIGEIAIRDLEVFTYKDLIYEIKVTTDKDPQLFKGLEKAFGNAKHSVVENKYYWQGEEVKLSFESVAKRKVQLVYHAFDIKDIIKQDATKKVEDLSSEF